MLGRVGALVVVVTALDCAMASADPLIVTQQAKLLASDGAANDSFGGSVSVSGDTAVVGDYTNNVATGAAYVFVRSGTTWSEQAKLLASDGAASDFFGHSVSVAGETVVVGANNKDSGTGAAYVFVRSGTTWSEEAKLVASGGAGWRSFGQAVSILGDTVVVGAPNENISIGATYVFVRSGGVWSQQARLLASDGVRGDLFGLSASVSGDTAAVGAWGKSPGGAAYVFVRNGTAWSQQAELLASDVAFNDCFGGSVSVSGDTAVVGASNKDSGTGAAYVFVRSGTTWFEQAKLLASDGAAWHYFGDSVSVSGDTAVVGAPQDYINPNAGAAYVFGRSDTVWSLGAKVLASDGAVDDCFGLSVSVSGNTALGGAWNNRPGGAAYVFIMIRANGDPCATAVECQSGFCTDGICCNEACDSPCHFCQLSGHEGTCLPVPDNQDPRQECRFAGGNGACAGTCVSQQCAFPPAGSSCDTCSVCDGAGRCAQTLADDDACGTIACSGLDTACRAYQDLKTNRCESLGTCKAANDPATCTQWADVPCDGGLAQQDAGAVPHDGGAAQHDGGATQHDGGSAHLDGGVVGLRSRGCACEVGSRATASAGAIVLLLAVAVARGSRRRPRGPGAVLSRDGLPL
ncbi:MAG: FG-GAP repeat protein [Deltaproteobacteria bacterium]|nr:FG-GAP repeat protein [Deltaproteobacteria bacterium]